MQASIAYHVPFLIKHIHLKCVEWLEKINEN